MSTQKPSGYIDLFFDAEDHPYYVEGHVTLEDAEKALRIAGEQVKVRSVAHKYGRLVAIGPDHEDCIEGLTSTFRVIDTPRPSYYPVTECEAERVSAVERSLGDPSAITW